VTAYYTRKQEGRCVACGARTQRTISGKTRCEKCEEHVKENRRYRSAMRMKSGLCIWCGKPSEGRLCDDCRVKERAYAREAKRRQAMKRSIDKKDSQ